MTVAFSRGDPRHYTPDRLPREFLAYDQTVDHLDTGRPGKVGLLEVTFASDGITRLVHHFQQTPLHVFRPLYVDPGRPDLAVVYVLSAGGGVLQGDRYRLDVVCEEGAAVHLTTQAATKLYRMDRNYASQLLHLTAGPQSFLEYLPDPIIPYRDARFFQRTLLTIHPTATAILGETLLPGRVAHGERHAYTHFVGQTETRTPDGRLLFADTINLAPSSSKLQSPGRLGDHDVLASLFVVSQVLRPRDLNARLRAALDHHPAIAAGASELPNGAGVSVRILGPTSTAVRAALHATWNEARLAAIGVPAPNLRKP
ncbi:MAG TPA: urease accessory protein UreD [Thermomicrobiales bacterium]|jgi:urease accessory protein